MSEYRTFVVPYDFSAHAHAALATAADLARRLGGADLHLVHVVQPPAFAAGYGPFSPDRVPPPFELAQILDGAMMSLRAVVAMLVGASVRLEPHVLEGADIAGALAQEAERLGADLIVMGTHGRTGLAHAFLGSVAERTLRNAPCPVLTVRAREHEEAH